MKELNGNVEKFELGENEYERHINKKSNKHSPSKAIIIALSILFISLTIFSVYYFKSVSSNNYNIYHEYVPIEKIAKETEVFLLDMDGTIYFDSTPIGDMINTLKKLRKAGKKLVYFTNNSSKTPKEYVNKLKKIGFYEPSDLVYTSGMSTAEYINEFHKGKKVYLVGTDALKDEWRNEYKINLVEDASAEVAVLSYDVTLTFEKLKLINKLIVNGATYIATHPDVVCPSKDVFPPDVGSFISLLKTSSGKEPEVICGKPSKTMGDCIMRKLGITDRRKIAMVGDRLHTDIRFGVNNGFHTILVMSGETTEEILKKSNDRPECILDSLNDIVNYL